LLDDAAPLRLAERPVVADQDRPDHLAADQRRDARARPVPAAAELAGEQLLPAGPLPVRATGADGEARLRLGMVKANGELGVAIELRRGQQAILAVVATGDHDRGAAEESLEVALDQHVQLGLGANHVHRLGQVALLVAMLVVGDPSPSLGPDPDPPGEGKQGEHAAPGHDGKDGGPGRGQPDGKERAALPAP
jgi:hypothetical protein